MGGLPVGPTLADSCDVTLLTYRKRDRPDSNDELPEVRVVEWTEPSLIESQSDSTACQARYLPFYVGPTLVKQAANATRPLT